MADRERRILPRHAEGVLLRRFAPSDLREFQAYRSDAELARYQGWSAQPDDEAAEFLARMAGARLFQPGQWTQVAIVERATQALIGDIGSGSRGSDSRNQGRGMEGDGRKQDSWHALSARHLLIRVLVLQHELQNLLRNRSLPNRSKRLAMEWGWTVLA